MTEDFSQFQIPKRMKRADHIVDAIKRWIVIEDIQPGDKLPNEKTLMEQFDCAKGTVREALKSLEVQGLITIKTGPNGGAALAEVPYGLTAQMLRNYLHFQKTTGPSVYGLRKLIEPEIAALAVENLTAADIVTLERLTACCQHPPVDIEDRLTQRMSELDFHNLLADRCNNPILAFMGRFLNDLLKDLVIYKKTALPEQIEFSNSNLQFHIQLIDAFKQHNRKAVFSLMQAHMEAAEKFNIELEIQLNKPLL